VFVCVQSDADACDVLTDKQKVELEELRTSKSAEGRVLLQVGSAVCCLSLCIPCILLYVIQMKNVIVIVSNVIVMGKKRGN